VLQKDSQADRPPRQLILFFDGTNNTLTGGQKDTNVLKLYEHLAAGQDGGQLIYYDPGVGSPDALPSTGLGDGLSRRWERISGLAYGRGIYENIREAYTFLIRYWQPGDQVWLFGFSRGAFAARCVSGIVHLFGIIDRQHESLLDTVMRVYFAGTDDGTGRARQRKQVRLNTGGIESDHADTRTRGDVAGQIRRSFTTGERREASVHFVGVWDTVESVGVPLLSVRITSAATITGKRICHARHALSLDEQRLSFRPRLYDEPDFGTPDGAQSLRQRWFRGVHSDIGGGYLRRESGLSHEALAWMLSEARQCGLRDARDLAPDGAVKLHDATFSVPWWALAGLTVRDPVALGPKATRIEHPSVAAQPDPMPSVWTAPGHRGANIGIGASIFGALVSRWLQALALAGTWPGFAALELPSKLARAQLALLWTRPGDLAPLAQAFGPGIGWAMLADMLLAASYGYLLARVAGWAFRRAAGVRRLGQGVPAWRWLGLAPLCAVGADACENVLTALASAWDGPVGLLQGLVLYLVGLAAAAKFLGLLGCAALALVALCRPRLRQPSRDSGPPAGAGITDR